MSVMICDGKVIKERVFNELYGVSEEQLKKFIEIGEEKGFFEYKIANDTFKIHVLGRKKREKQRGDGIFFPHMHQAQRKFFITNIRKSHNIPDANTFEIFITVYGEAMPKKEFLRRAGFHCQFLSSHGLTKAGSFKLNGIEITIERRIKDLVKYNVLNTETNVTTPNLTAREVMAFTGCPHRKAKQSIKKNSIANYKNYRIKRVGI